MNNVAVFAFAQLINVIFGTVRYITTVKSGPLLAACINALSCTISSAITYYLVKQEILVVLIVIFCTNMVGVPLGQMLMRLIDKDHMWIYDATIKASLDKITEIKHILKGQGIQSVYTEIVEDKMYDVRFFSNSKNDSRLILKQLKDCVCKYHIIEPR